MLHLYLAVHLSSYNSLKYVNPNQTLTLILNPNSKPNPYPKSKSNPNRTGN